MALIVLAALAGCSKKSPDLSGRWNMMMGPANMQVEFGSGGAYTGTMNGPGGVGQVTGTYTVKGDILEMQPPTITGPGGSTTPPGGLMKVKMIPQGPNAILLDAGDKKFQMTRISP